ncbi:hypothetical protein [Brevibacillus laterosporus]|uniref:hypothetical protein n=1 Tax=Brevibacillus laterosporus TaxID=1465 RepID=UPI003D1FB925
MSSAIKAFDRAQDAYNLAKKEPVQQKVMIFVVPSKIKLGIVRTEVRFPYRGKIVDVYASCGIIGSGDTVLSVEKCIQENYDNLPSWNSITDVTIEANEKSTRTSTVPFKLSDEKVNEGDHFRINVTDVGDGIEDITVEIIVAI